MSEYTDIQLINCNRSASVEARSGNNTNPAIFTNPLQQSVKLDVGDTINLERSFISEIGAGNPSTIEFKGSAENDSTWSATEQKQVEGHKVPPYTEIVYDDYFYKKSATYDPNYRLGNYRTITTTLKENETIDLQDNLSPMTFGYYITSNEYPNWVQQPRRFLQSFYTARPTTPPQVGYDIYTARDGEAAGSTTYSVNSNMYAYNDWTTRIGVAGTIIRQKIKNERYTLFIKSFMSFSKDAGTTAQRENMNPLNIEGIFSDSDYIRIRERKDIRIDKGFNTPSDVASQITAQLKETETPETFEILDASGGKQFIRPITKTISSTTYKPINAQNFYNYNATTYADFMTKPTRAQRAASQLSIDYLSQFTYIGVKRPEIYEEGRAMMNLIAPDRDRSPDIRNVAGAIIGFGTGSSMAGADFGYEGFKLMETLTLTNGTVAGQPNPIDPTQGVIVLNVIFNEANLAAILKFLDTQSYYPELWDDLTNNQNYNSTVFNPAEGSISDGITQEFPDVNNSKFFHCNQYPTEPTATQPQNGEFGSDNFVDEAGDENVEKASNPFMFRYDDTQRTKYVNPEMYNKVRDEADLYYGFATPIKIVNYESTSTALVPVEVPKAEQYFIQLRVGSAEGATGLNRGIGGVPTTLYTNKAADIDPDTALERSRRIGYDFHSTAFSTALITPSAGYASVDIGTLIRQADAAASTEEITLEDSSSFLKNQGDVNVTDIAPYMTQTYIGANNPALLFNSVNNRFEFNGLHTANNVGNADRAGASGQINSRTMIRTKEGEQIAPLGTGPEISIVAPTVNEDAADTVYKLTPRPPQFGYSPNFKPYTNLNQNYRTSPWNYGPNDVTGAPSVDFPATDNNKRFYSEPNECIEPYEIFDSHGGIYIDDFGYEKEFWEGSMWDILGFSYDQLNTPPDATNVLIKRVNNDNNQKLYRLTTNAEVVSTDSKSYVANNFGASLYYTSLSFPRGILNWETVVAPGGVAKNGNFTLASNHGNPLPYYPEIIVKTQSITIPAKNLSKSVLKPYYTIRSSILEGATAIGGNPTGANLPIISILDKYSAQGDYFFGNPSELSFTVTKPTILSDIVTSIHDPDGTYSNINNTSAVIYKITKLRAGQEDIIDQILKAVKKK